MAKTIIIGGTGWTETFPQRVRGDLTRMVFSLARQFNWNIAVAGQKWSHHTTPDRKRAKSPPTPLDEARWAMLMNIVPE
jgi:hypothetical protein